MGTNPIELLEFSAEMTFVGEFQLGGGGFGGVAAGDQFSGPPALESFRPLPGSLAKVLGEKTLELPD